MVKRALLLLAVGVAIHPLLAASRGWVAVEPKVEKSSAILGVVLWDGKKWNLLPFRDGNWHPESLATLGKGVVCVWRNYEAPDDVARYRLSFHEGAKSRWLNHAAMQAPSINQILYGPQFLKTDAAQLLLINQRDFFLVAPDGKVTRLFSLTPDKRQRLGPPEDYSLNVNELRIVDDKHGGYWFWSNVWEHGARAYSLRGLLHWDGRKLEHLTSLSGLSLTKTAIDALELRDQNHLWLALGERGLFELDSRTLKTRPVAEPAPKAFRYVQQITPSGRDLFVVAFSRLRDSEDEITVRLGQLWRLRDGKWQRLIEGLGRWTGDGTPRPILSTSSGVWAATTDGEVWLVPPSGTPVLLDWHQGLPFRSVNSISAQKDGSVLISGWGNKALSAHIINVAALLAQRPTPRVNAFLSYLDFAQDRKGRIWTVLNLRTNALSHWDGARWIHHAVPRNYKLTNANELAFDRFNRVWILSDWRDGQVAIFDPAKTGAEAWRVFANYRAALQAQLSARPPALPLFFPKTSDGEVLPYQTPDFQNGRLCYRDADARLHYFDGKAWHRWTDAQIDPKVTSANEELGVPFFNRAGVLCVEFNSHIWNLTPRGWSVASNDDEDPRPAAQPESISAELPEDAFKDERNQGYKAARDREGFYYVAIKGNLFRMTPDKVSPRVIAPLFEPDENHPFMDGSQFKRILFDGNGNLFFDMDDNEMVFLPASRTAPDTKITTRAVSVDAYEIACTTTAVGSHWFVWRLDGGKWSAPQAASKIQLKELPGGAHRMEVAVMDRYLRRDPTPAVVTFNVNLDANQQVADFIADLSSPDYAQREKAVVGLAKQPQRATPALRAAREKANADLKWWIDAALQACERK